MRSADTTKDVKILHVAGGALWVGGAKAMYIHDCEVRHHSVINFHIGAQPNERRCRRWQ